jgi:hypothetical protein
MGIPILLRDKIEASIAAELVKSSWAISCVSWLKMTNVSGTTLIPSSCATEQDTVPLRCLGEWKIGWFIGMYCIQETHTYGPVPSCKV